MAYLAWGGPAEELVPLQALLGGTEPVSEPHGEGEGEGEGESE